MDVVLEGHDRVCERVGPPGLQNLPPLPAGSGNTRRVCTDQPGPLASPDEQIEVDAVPGRRLGVEVGVHLHDLEPAGHLARQRLHLARDPVARSAPVGPKVDQHRSVRREDLLLKVVVTDVDRLRHAMRRGPSAPSSFRRSYRLTIMEEPGAPASDSAVSDPGDSLRGVSVPSDAASVLRASSNSLRR